MAWKGVIKAETKMGKRKNNLSGALEINAYVCAVHLFFF